MDIQSAYRLIPVRLDDRHLHGMRWRGSVTLDTALSFGLRSAPKIFSAVADSLLFMFRRDVSSAIHYLDDFLFCGAAGSGKCAQNLASALTTCRDLGVPVGEHKTRGPSTVLTFLGIEIDTVHMQLRLPSEKLARLQDALLSLSTRRGGTKKELLSLIGSLYHACALIKPGRAFLRRLIELCKVPKALHHFVCLNKEGSSDIARWAAFASRWNGIGLLSVLGKVRSTVCLESDASGGWGCGAVWQHRWLQLKWEPGTERLGIAAKETFPGVLAAVCWGRSWTSKHVLFNVVNSTVVSALRSGSCRDQQAMCLIRLLHFVVAELQFTFTAELIPGTENIVANAISRNLIATMFDMCPQLSVVACQMPEGWIALLEDNTGDWTSSWRTQFLIEAGIATSTAKAYRSGQRRFLDFVRASEALLYAVSEETLCCFVAYLETCHLAYNTVKGYLSTVRHLLICRRRGEVFARPLPRLVYMLRGVRRIWGERAARPRLPITPDILCALRRHWSASGITYDVVML